MCCISRTATGDKDYRKEYQNNYVVVFKSLHVICAWISFFFFPRACTWWSFLELNTTIVLLKDLLDFLFLPPLFKGLCFFFTLKKKLKIAMAYNKNPLSKWGGVNPFKVEHQIVENSYWLSGPLYIYRIKRGYLIYVTVIKTNAHCSVECYSLKL